MKRIGSIWMAAARNLWWKLLLILLLLAAAEYGLFHWAGLRGGDAWTGDGRKDFVVLVENAHLGLAFFVALAAVVACCIWQGCRFSGKNVYTLRRLPMEEWQITALWFPVHLACLVILWAAQVLLILILWHVFARSQSPASPGLELVTAMYRCNFLHAMLPLADWTRWMYLLSYWVCLGWMTASFGFFQRRGRYRIGVPVVLGCFLTLTGDMGSSGSDMAFTVLIWLAVGINLAAMWGACHEEHTA